MSTDYYGIPSFAERIIGADVILIGAIGRLIAVEPLQDASMHISGKFEIHIENIWKGQPDAALELRVLGKRDGDRFVGIVDLQEGEHYLLMLARDSAPLDKATWYVPYFSAVYPLNPDGQVQLPTETLDERTQEIADSSGPEIPLEALHKVVNVLLREREEERRRIREIVPDELLAQSYLPIEEMPEESPGAGRNASAPGDVPLEGA
jgi:hypothetical protein